MAATLKRVVRVLQLILSQAAPFKGGMPLLASNKQESIKQKDGYEEAMFDSSCLS